MSTFQSPALNNTGATNLADYTILTVSKYGDRVAQVDPINNNIITFREIVQKAANLSNILKCKGVGNEDVVTFISKNTIDYAWITLGISLSGAVCNLLAPILKPGELIHILGLIQPQIVIAPELSQEQLDAILSFEGIGFVFKENDECWDAKRCRPFTDLSQMPNGCWKPQPTFSSDLYDTAFLLSSSGSTGLPKAVVIQNRNIIAALSHSGLFMRFNGTALGLMPFYHAYGLGLLFMALCEGSKMVVIPKYNADSVLNFIQDFHISHLYLVPSLVATLGKSEKATPKVLESVREIFTGAGYITPIHQKALLEKLDPAAKMYHSYGMTETTFVVIFGAVREDKPSSPGKRVPGITTKIVSEDGVEVKIGQVGELLVKGPMVVKGYLNNPEATKETIDPAKWMHTGDLAYQDSDGYFYIVDRIKEIIKYQGFQISPNELEFVLLKHEGIAEAAVLGIPHDTYGEVPRAFIVRAENAELTKEQVQQLIKNELTYYKQLRGGVQFVDEIPKSPNGKILRKKLKELYC